MKPIARRLLRCSSLVLVLLAFVSCGDEPQRIGKSEPMSAGHAPFGDSMPPGHPPVGDSMPSGRPPVAAGMARLGGRVRLAGNLAKARSGAVFVIARSDGKLALVHKYDMTDPLWADSGNERVLTFSLTDADNMAGVGAPVGSKLDVEARYDPEGFVGTTPSDKPGVVRSIISAAAGDTKLELKLDPSAPGKASGG
jgi:hypothetical protein